MEKTVVSRKGAPKRAPKTPLPQDFATVAVDALVAAWPSDWTSAEGFAAWDAQGQSVVFVKPKAVTGISDA